MPKTTPCRTVMVMAFQQQHALNDLRRAVDRLPTSTREVMLVALARDVVIVGADTDRDGGACPMLAAHRRGARANFVAFAQAWDRFTGVAGRDVSRRATADELAALTGLLRESLDGVEESADLSAAITDHQALVRGGREQAPVDLSAAITDHQSMARARRAHEAADVGHDWLDEWLDTVVEAAPAPERHARRLVPA